MSFYIVLLLVAETVGSFLYSGNFAEHRQYKPVKVMYIGLPNLR